MSDAEPLQLNRRNLLIGGGVGVGLLLTLMVYGALRAMSRKRLMLDHE